MSARRLSIAAVVLLCCRTADSEQILERSAIRGWPAAPLWISSHAIDLEKRNDARAAEPAATDGVPTAPLPLIAIAPCRIVDTRGNGFAGAYGPPGLVQGGPRNLALAGQCGIAGAAEAVSLNITVTNTEGPGYILVYPQGGTQPNVSTLNYVAGQTIANAAVVPLGVGGGVTVIAGVSGTDLIIDTNGYYAPQTVVNTVNGLSGAVALAAGANVSITPSGNTLTIAATGGGPAGWSLTGNAGTTPGANFLGTTDNQALEFKVNAKRAFRLEPSDFGPNVVGGFSGNAVLGSAYGATIAGGGSTGAENKVTDNFGSIGGGSDNRAGNAAGISADAAWATVGGGGSNQAVSTAATVSGGISNVGIGSYSAIGGGAFNYSGNDASVAGGDHNSASGDYASVPTVHSSGGRPPTPTSRRPAPTSSSSALPGASGSARQTHPASRSPAIF